MIYVTVDRDRLTDAEETEAAYRSGFLDGMVAQARKSDIEEADMSEPSLDRKLELAEHIVHAQRRPDATESMRADIERALSGLKQSRELLRSRDSARLHRLAREYRKARAAAHPRASAVTAEIADEMAALIVGASELADEIAVDREEVQHPRVMLGDSPVRLAMLESELESLRNELRTLRRIMLDATRPGT